MANTIVRGQIIFQDENALAHGKKAVAAGKGKSSLAAPTKNGAGFISRKALNDITNKAKLQPPQVCSKNKNVENDFDIAKEGFLHDHKKCIQEQQNNQWEDNYFSELILVHGQDNNIKEVIHEDNTKEKDESTYTLEELKEISVEEFSDWLECSPPNSPIDYLSSLPSSPLPWRFETVEFKLKEDDDSI